jgi:hypothetical protein
MSGFLADDTNNVSLSSRHPEALSDHHLFIPPTERREPQEALLIDVGDDEANLIDVSGEQHFRCTGHIVPRLDPGKRVPHNVMRHFIGEGRSFFAPYPSRRRLVARWARGVQ